MRIAVIGSGIAGLAAAYRLQGLHTVTLFEAEGYFGGHSHTVDVTLPVRGQAVTYGVDTGFLVFNERTYPQLIALFARLGVATAPAEMSFSVQAPQDDMAWSGSSLNAVFSQRRNLFKPRFWRMLRDLLHFNAATTRLATTPQAPELNQSLGAFLDQQGYSTAFRDWYLLPMLGCIWSCPTDHMLAFPLATLVRFCHNHGLLQISARPQWHTVVGGSARYVEKMLAAIPQRRLNCPVRAVQRLGDGVDIVTDGQTERFDRVVLATHPDQTLALLSQPSPAELAVLGAIRYQPNEAVLHTDATVLPRQPRAWAAWNYERGHSDARVCLHYLINRLQPLPFEQPVVVSLNPVRAIAPDQVLGRYHYAHPVFDAAALAAQAQLAALQGQQHSYFCGAWTGYGFHEDGLKSGLHVAQLLGAAAAPAPV